MACARRRTDLEMKRSQFLFLLKLLAGFGLLAILLLQGDTFAETISVLEKLDAVGVVLVALMPAPLVWASCLKWRLLLGYRGIHVGIGSLMRYYTVGYWFNNFFPSSLGGDTARSYLVGKKIGSQAESFASVVLERLTGLLTLVTLAFLGFLAMPSIQGDPIVYLSLAAMGGGCLVLSFLIWGPKWLIPGSNAAVMGLKPLAKAFSALEKVRAAMQTFWEQPQIVRRAVLYSFGYHALTVLNVYVAAWALGVEVSFLGLCVVTPIILVIAALPTTPGSIGVWEWAYSVLLMPIGAELEQGLAIGLVLRAQLLFASLLGGVLYVTDRPAA